MPNGIICESFERKNAILIADRLLALRMHFYIKTSRDYPCTYNGQNIFIALMS